MEQSTIFVCQNERRFLDSVKYGICSKYVVFSIIFNYAFTFEGLLKLDDPIHMYFPELDGTEIDNEYYRACTIRDLITMRSGQKRSSWND